MSKVKMVSVREFYGGVPDEINKQFSEGSVVLGYLSSEIDPKEDKDAFNSKIGGRPVTFGEEFSFPNCKNCGGKTSLVLQAYSPLEDLVPIHHRILFLFVCPTTECSGISKGWTALRYQVQLSPEEMKEWNVIEEEEEVKETKKSTKLFEETSWGDEEEEEEVKEDPKKTESAWGEEEEEEEKEEEDLELLLKMRDIAFEEKKAKEKEKETREKNPPKSSVPSSSEKPISSEEDVKFDIEEYEKRAAFQGFYLEVEDEPKEKKKKKIDDDRWKEYQKEESSSGKEETWDNEKYESTERVFLKFQKRMARSPEQIVRYSFGGAPIWIDNDKPIKLSSCSHCGSSRVFELQLLPTVISLGGLIPTPPKEEARKKEREGAVSKEQKEALDQKYSALKVEFGNSLVLKKNHVHCHTNCYLCFVPHMDIPEENQETNRSDLIRITVKNGEDKAEIMMERRDLEKYSDSYFYGLLHFQDHNLNPVGEIELEADIMQMISICSFLKSSKRIGLEYSKNQDFHELVNYLKVPVYDAGCFYPDCPFFGTREQNGLCSGCANGDTRAVYLKREEERDAKNAKWKRDFEATRHSYAFNKVASDTLLDEIGALEDKTHTSIDEAISRFNRRMISEGVIAENKGITAEIGDNVMTRFFANSTTNQWEISNMLAHKWVVDPWNLSSKLHPTGSCYFGNFGEFPYKDQFEQDAHLIFPRDWLNYLYISKKPGALHQNM
eukprot:TRINITY_DN4776_c0_g1_i2.p1 TRINITY_DN4776_c0_g1~~TRINITY_DN4776_c0_g1_i2.p1  ORF type:complete len:723 (-),score=237.95 TRINITY_DN4776_c0_g1_i2:141-2309(-)